MDNLQRGNRDQTEPGSPPEEAASSFRAIPAMTTILAEARRNGSLLADEVILGVARDVVAQERLAIEAGALRDRAAILSAVQEALALLEGPRLCPVLNATGVIIHTNLGRAPVSAEAAAAMQDAAANAVALEIDPASNQRGGRMRELTALFRVLTGAEAALVVNNGASAVLLALAATCAGKDVAVSRGEAIEIGGGFRIPDVLVQSGANLVEVGTTNRTYVSDYAAATNGETGAYLKVHPSNFRTSGFTHAVSTAELADAAHAHGLLLLEDLGSGALLDTSRFGLAHEPTLGEALAAGADLVMASGDKLIGGPQAGIILGRKETVARVTAHPLARAVRADKVTLAGLAATLRHYARGEAEAVIPIWRMANASQEAIHERAAALTTALTARGIAAAVCATQATMGGGSLPGETLPSWAVALRAPGGLAIEALAQRLRLGSDGVPGLFGRIEQDRLLLDLRTILPESDCALRTAVEHACSR